MLKISCFFPKPYVLRTIAMSIRNSRPESGSRTHSSKSSFAILANPFSSCTSAIETHFQKSSPVLRPVAIQAESLRSIHTGEDDDAKDLSLCVRMTESTIPHQFDLSNYFFSKIGIACRLRGWTTPRAGQCCHSLWRTVCRNAFRVRNRGNTSGIFAHALCRMRDSSGKHRA